MRTEVARWAILLSLACWLGSGCGPTPEHAVHRAAPFAGQAPPQEQAPAATPPPALPGTGLIRPPALSEPPSVRIWLASASGNPEVSCTGPLQVLAAGKSAHLERLKRATVKMTPGGFRVGETTWSGPTIEFRPEGASLIRIDGRAYSGRIRLIKAAGRIAVINVLNLEDYLAGVLAAEVPGDWPPQALRAQAVASRTYALYHRLSRAEREWDMTNGVDDQAYSGAVAPAAIGEAVRATRGEVLLHRGAVFPAFFHSTCGGSTENPAMALGKEEYGFLEAVSCTFCADSPHYRWSERIAASELARRLRSAGFEVGDVIALETATATHVGSVVRVGWSDGDRFVPMADFRRAVGRMLVRSGKFEARLEGDSFLLVGRGLGHGAGMCQYGCRGMALAGHSYRQILGHYYRNVAVEKLY